MVRTRPSLEDVLRALPSFSREARRKVLSRLCQYPDLREDFEDLLAILERQEEPSRPYEEFAQELRREGRL